MRQTIAALSLAVVSALAALGTAPAGHDVSAQDGQPEARTGDVIVRFRSGASLTSVGGALADSETTAVKTTTLRDVALVEPHPGQTVDAAISALEADPDVLYAEPDYVVTIDTIPNDTNYASPYAPCGCYQWHYPKIGLPAAWDQTTGSATVIVAVVDTGVELTDTELDSKITSGANAGYDFANGDADATDDNGHGTHVAGTIAAETNNATGVAGVCWACKIMPVKVLDEFGGGSTFDVASGIDWARTHGAKVVNLSLGSLGNDVTLQNAVNSAYAAGVVVVGAAGNNAGDADTSDDAVMFPGAYANAIGVGATNSSDVIASFSNYGPELDVVAPGVGILSTVLGTGYQSWSGTSMATPHVAGVVGLMISAGITDPATIRTKLTSTATDLGAAGFDNSYGYGRINAHLAVASTAQYGVTWGANTLPASIASESAIAAVASFTNSGSLTWDAAGGSPVRFAYHWRNGACAGTSLAVWDGTRTAIPSNVASSATVANLNVSIQAPASAGTYCLQYDLVREGVTWFSSQGAATQSATVTVTSPTYSVTWGADTTPATANAGSTITPAISFSNSGSLAWLASGSNPVRLAYHWFNGACAGSTVAVWEGVRSALPADVAPGGSVTNLAAVVGTPAAGGTYCLQYDLVREGVAWFSGQSAATKSVTVTIVSPYGVSWGANTIPGAMAASSMTTAGVSFTNAGSLTWLSGGANPVRVSYHWRNGACGGTSQAIWDGERTALQVDMVSSSTASNLSTTVIAPASAGTYCLVYDLVREGVTWFSWQGAATQSGTVTVTPQPAYGISWLADTTPSSMVRGSANAAALSFQNAGTLTWSAGGANPVRVSYHWRNGACGGTSQAIWDGARTALQADMMSGSTASNLSATVIAPASAGTYCLVYDLVREGVTWFSWQGASTLSRTVTISAP